MSSTKIKHLLRNMNHSSTMKSSGSRGSWSGQPPEGIGSRERRSASELYLWLVKNDNFKVGVEGSHRGHDRPIGSSYVQYSAEAGPHEIAEEGWQSCKDKRSDENLEESELTRILVHRQGLSDASACM